MWPNPEVKKNSFYPTEREFHFGFLSITEKLMNQAEERGEIKDNTVLKKILQVSNFSSFFRYLLSTKHLEKERVLYVRNPV